MAINAIWHEAHRMPKNPTKEERYSWHLEHAQNCNCRKMSDKLQAEIKAWQTTKK